MEGKEEGEQEQLVQGEKDDPPVGEKKVIEKGGEQVRKTKTKTKKRTKTRYSSKTTRCRWKGRRRVRKGLD